MKPLERFNPDTLTAYRALLVCFFGSIGGVAAASFVGDMTSFGYLSQGTFFMTVFAFLIFDWAINGRPRCYDPAKTFLAFTCTSSIAAAILYFFFYRPGAGPFSEQLFTVPNILANIAFGLLFPALLAAVLGLTYRAARQSLGEIPWTRVLGIFFALFVPFSLMILLETLFIEWIQASF